MITPAVHRQVADLLFEIAQGHEPKFLLAVCGDSALRASLIGSLFSNFAVNGISAISLSATDLKSNLLAKLYEAGHSGDADALLISNFDSLDDDSFSALCREFNFHRDAIAKLSIAVVLWLNPRELGQLATYAPDFWSRRTAVYHLGPHPGKELLRQIFTAAKGSKPTLAASPLSIVIRRILDAERDFGGFLRRSRPNVEGIDECLRKMHAAIAELRSFVKEGKRIDIALQLWNISNLDRELQLVLGKLDDHEQDFFDYIYTDRNDALLHAADHLDEILCDYLLKLDETVAKRKIPRLVSMFRKIALNRLTEIVNDLISSIHPALEDIEDLTTEDVESSSSGEESWDENAFGVRAAYDLESWLSGYNDECSRAFDKREQTILKLMYSSDMGVAGIASQLRLSSGSKFVA